jgi:hypothetical protein
MNPGKEKGLFQHWAENLAHGSRPTGHWVGLAGLARPCGLVLAKTLLGRIAPREKMRGRHCLASSSSSAQRLARWLPAAHAPERGRSAVSGGNGPRKLGENDGEITRVHLWGLDGDGVVGRRPAIEGRTRGSPVASGACCG